MAVESLLAKTRNGTVRGGGLDDGYVFRGIPFCAPPVGPRRWKAPEPVEPWDGVRDATRFAPICPQMQPGLISPLFAALHPEIEEENEDCLYLNVWTPSLSHDHLPVMVWIHGGGWSSGSGSAGGYDGATLMQQGVVVVTLNYRLSLFAALDFTESGAPTSADGNLAILDLISALEWVAENIEEFGGDPQNVTIFGESAGGTYTTALLGVPAARQYFRRSIVQSGVRSLRSHTSARATTAALLDQWKVTPSDWDAITRIPASEILAASMGIKPELVSEDETDRRLWWPSPFSWIIDGDSVQDPWESLRSGAAAGIDLLIGHTAEEMYLLMFGRPGEVAVPDLDRVLPSRIASRDDLVSLYRLLGRGTEEIDILGSAETDRVFMMHAVAVAEAALAGGGTPYMYRFSWPSPVLDGRLGACHALEVPFLFGTLDVAKNVVGDEPPEDLAANMQRAWINFATSGNPNTPGLPMWTPYTLTDRAVMDLNTESQLINNPNGTERELWSAR